MSTLVPHIDELLSLEAKRVEAVRSVISGLSLILRTEDGALTTDLIRPAIPTLDVPLLARLIALRLSARQFTSGVEDIEILSERTRPSRTQEELFDSRGRDLQAGARAIAALRARFGDNSVTCAKLCDSWLPEQSWSWVPLTGLALPSPRAVPAPPSAVRRILHTPRQVKEVRSGIRSGMGRFVLSGRWWGTGNGDASFHREYSFRECEGGVHWLYVDKLSGTTWIQGTVD